MNKFKEMRDFCKEIVVYVRNSSSVMPDDELADIVTTKFISMMEDAISEGMSRASRGKAKPSMGLGGMMIDRSKPLRDQIPEELAKEFFEETGTDLADYLENELGELMNPMMDTDGDEKDKPAVEDNDGCTIITPDFNNKPPTKH